MKLYLIEIEFDRHTDSYVVGEKCDLKRFIEDKSEGCAWVNVSINVDLKFDEEQALDWVGIDLNEIWKAGDKIRGSATKPIG